MRARFECCGQTCELPRFVDVRGLLAFWVLWELRLGTLNGAQIAERIAWRRGDALSPGTLYPALASLTKARLVAKRRAGRDTVYGLTPQGSAELECASMYLRIVFADVVRGESLLRIQKPPR